MRLPRLLTIVGFLGASIVARGSSLVLDDFSCSDTVTLTGATGFNASFASCPDALGGAREDFIFVPSSSGSSDSVSTMNSNPPAGAVTGMFGGGISQYEGMQWTGSTTPSTFNLNLNLVGDSILLQLKSDSSGSALVFFGDAADNLLRFSTTFSASASYQDVLIPLTNPTVIGGGADLTAANQILLDIGLDTPGGTWSIDAASIESPAPEPATLVLSGIGLLCAMTRSFCRVCRR